MLSGLVCSFVFVCLPGPELLAPEALKVDVKALAHAYRDGDVSVTGSSYAGYSIASLEKNIFYEEKGALHFYTKDSRLDFKYPGRGKLLYFSDSVTRAILSVDRYWVVRQFEAQRKQWLPVAALEAAPEAAPEAATE
jgi:hypothetical protein